MSLSSLTANDGQISRSDEMLVIVKQANLAPVILGVSAPSVLSVLTTGDISASYDDDGLPSGILKTVWSKVSGPGPAVFANAADAATTVEFVTAGDYVLRFTVSDTELTTEAEVGVHVPADNSGGSAFIYAGPDRTVGAGEPLSLQGILVHPNPSRTFPNFNWQPGGGPGTIRISDQNKTNTTATFDLPGVYQLYFNAFDPGFELFLSDTLIVTVLPANGQNQSPVISIAPVFTLMQPNSSVAIPFEISDDGLPVGGTLTYNWSVVSGPGSATFASGPVAGHPHGFSTTVTAATAGLYVLQLTASDSALTVTQQVQLQVVDPTNGNAPPRANAGPDQTVMAGVNLVLTGSATDDGQPGQGLFYTWSQVSGPVTASIAWPYTDVINASFSYPGVYVLRLSVSDQLLTDSDDVVITVTPAANVAPQVDAGPSTSIMLPTNSITLQGTASDDGNPAGSTLSAQWSLLFGPGPVTFSDATSLQPTVTFDGVEGISWYYAATYQFLLTVTDGELTTSRAVTITVGNPDYFNRAPIVDAGPDATSTLPDLFPLSGSFTDETLFDYPYSYWTVVSGPAPVSIEYFPVPGARFIAPGIYVLRFTVLDGFNGGLYASDDLTVTVLNPPNFAPRIDAGAPRSIALRAPTIDMQGSASDDGKPDGSVLTTGWSQVDGPGTAIFADTNNLASSVTFPLAGIYVLRLTGTDGSLSTSSDVSITVVDTSIGNQPPSVMAGDDQTVTLGVDANLLATATDDGLPFGTLSYNWSLISGPASVQFSSFWDVSTAASFLAVGEYHLAFTASDGALSSSDEVVVTVLPGNAKPVIYPGRDTSVELSESLRLNAFIFEDGIPTGGAVTAQWTVDSGPGTVNFSSPTNIQADGNDAYHSSTLAGFSAPGSYVLRITASDSALSESQVLNVTVVDVVQGNKAPVIQGLSVGTVATFSPATISATVTDDGLPVGNSVTSLWSMVSGPGVARFADSRLLNTAVTFYAPGTYVLRLVASDGQLTAGDDLNVSVAQGTNTPPFVFAGDPMAVIRPGVAHLKGIVLDDGLPVQFSLTQTWAKVSGPGTVTFTPNATNLNVDATFSADGTYLLSLTASDGEFTRSNTVIVAVSSSVNQAPAVNGGPDFTTTVGESKALHTEATDDRLPGGVLEVFWSKVSGPGTAEFSTHNADYRVIFDQPGQYVLRLTANDSQLSSSDDVAVTVYPVATAPVVLIHAPVDGQPVTAPTNIIVTVQSALLASYQLQYRLKPGGNADETAEIGWITLATNNVPVTNAAIGQLDPTLLLNGIYELRVVVRDTLAQTTTSDLTTVIVDRKMKIGSFNLSFTDLTVPLPGLPLEVLRSYDSRDKSLGDFGIGWRLDLQSIRLQKNRHLGNTWEETSSGGDFPTYCLGTTKPRIISISFPTGKTYKFYAQPSPECQFGIPVDYPVMTYVPFSDAAGSSLRSVTGDDLAVAGSIPGFVDLYDFGALAEGSLQFEYNPTLFEFKTPEGFIYQIDEKEGLKSFTDPTGNTLTISTNGITHSVGKSIVFQRDNLGRITNIVDAAGNGMRYEYDASGNLTHFVDREGHTNTYRYDGVHGLVGITDARGVEVVQNEFDGAGRLVKSRDPQGDEIQYTHDLSGRQEIVRDRLGNSKISNYDERGNVIVSMAPDGGVTRMTYDANDNLLMKIDAVGRTNLYSYDSQNNVISQTDFQGNTTTYTYGPSRKMLTMHDGFGNSTTNVVDDQGRLLSVIDPLGNVTSFTYSTQGRVATRIDPMGNRTQFFYDNAGYLTNEVDALGHAKRYTVDAQGNMLSMSEERTTPNGVETTLIRAEYDKLNRLVRSTRPDGLTHQTVYNELGKKTAVIDVLGRQISFEYGARGNLTKTTYPDGTFTLAESDAEGRTTLLQNQAGQLTSFANDAMGRAVVTTNSDGTIVGQLYDLGGRVLEMTNELGFVTSYAFDSSCGCNGRRSQIVDPLGNVTTNQYDAKGNLSATIDPLNRLTQHSYEALGRRLGTIFPDNTAQTMTYDALGRLLTETDGGGHTSGYGYDPLGHLVTATNALGEVVRSAYDEVGNKIGVTDRIGRTTRFEYDNLRRPIKTIHPDGTFASTSYDAAGRAVSTTDEAGQTTHLGYDLADRLIASTNALGEVTRFEYDAGGRMKKLIDPQLRITQFEYDLRDRKIRTVYPDASSQTTVYDAVGHIIQTIDQSGRVTAMGYDAAGRLTSSTNALGQVTSMTYDAGGQLIAEMDANHQTTQYEYDLRGRRRKTMYPGGTTQRVIYDAVGRVVQRIDQDNHATGFGYDAVGRLTSQTNVLGQVARFVYDQAGQLVGEINANNQATGYSYDLRGRRISTTYPDGTTQNFTYDLLGRPFSQTDPNGNKSYFAYDSVGRLVASTNALGQVIRYEYNNLGQLISQTDARTNTTSFAYDSLGRQTTVTFPDGTSQFTSYDAVGRKVATTDQAGNGTQYGYNAVGQLTTVTNHLGEITQYTLDALGRVTAQVDANSHSTIFEYDSLGRRTKKTMPGGQVETYGYDDRGNLISRTNFNGFVTTYQFDDLNRLVAKVPDARMTNSIPATYGYNALGLRTNMTDASGVTTYSYDNRNRLVTKATPQGTLSYTYDQIGNLKSIKSSNANGAEVYYSYDVLNRLSTVNDAMIGRTVYNYDEAGNLSGYTYTNRVTSLYHYDSLNRLTNMSANKLLSPLANYDYTLTAAGKRSSVAEQSGRIVQYEYDPLSRLTNEVITAGMGSGSVAYGYDPVGNRLTRISGVAGVPSTTNTFDLNDRLNTDTYDANGNTLQGTVIDPILGTLSQVADHYDFEDRLIDHNNGQVEIVYDGDGNRVRKTVGIGTNAVTTYFLVDELNPTGYPQVLEELRSPNPADGTAAPVVTRVFTYGLQRIGQDQLLSNQWSVSFYGYDGSGSVRYLTDLGGQITDTFDYDAFGNLLAHTGTTPNKFLYRGEEYDIDLKLYYLRARYYNPHSGRFWTQDTFPGFSEEPASLHKYTYALNDGVNVYDPSGHFGVEEAVIASGISVLAANMLDQVRSGVNHFMMGLRGEDPAPSDSEEAEDIDSLAWSAGKAIGKTNFFKTRQGAPFLTGYNPYLVVNPCGDHSWSPYTGGWQTATTRVLVQIGLASSWPGSWMIATALVDTETECGLISEATNSIFSHFRAFIDAPTAYTSGLFEGGAEGLKNEFIGAGKLVKGMTFDTGREIALIGEDIAEANYGEGYEYQSRLFASAFKLFLSGKSNSELAVDAYLQMQLAPYRFVDQEIKNLKRALETGDYTEFSQNMGKVALLAIGTQVLIKTSVASESSTPGPLLEDAPPKIDFAGDVPVDTPPDDPGVSPEVYKASLKTQPTPSTTPQNLYEIANTGPKNYLIEGGGEKFWADGVMGTTVQESKFIVNAKSSPFIPGSSVPDFIRRKIVNEIDNEFARMAKIIADPENPLLDVEIIVNDPAARQFFIDLMRKHELNGRVIIR